MMAFCVAIGMVPAKAEAANGIVASVNMSGSACSVSSMGEFDYDNVYGNSCHITGQITASNVTKIVVKVETWEPHLMSLDGCDMADWRGVQAYYKGTSQAAKVEKTYNHANVNISLKNSVFDNGIAFGRLDYGWYRIVVEVYQNGSSTPSNGDLNGVSYDDCRFRVVSNPYKAINFEDFKNRLQYNLGYAIPGVIMVRKPINRIEAKVLDGASGGQYGYAVARYRSGYTKNGVNLSNQPVQYTWNCSVTQSWPCNFKPAVRLTGSPIDNNIFFGGLRRGNYYFQITVYFEDGNSITDSKAFTIY